MGTNVPITVAHGDGIGPEILMEGVLMPVYIGQPDVYAVAAGGPAATRMAPPRPPQVKEPTGVDILLDDSSGGPNDLGPVMEKICGEEFGLEMLSNRGVRVYPGGFKDTTTRDHWPCRCYVRAGGPMKHTQIIGSLKCVDEAGLDVIKIDNLCNFDGQPGFSLSQGQ